MTSAQNMLARSAIAALACVALAWSGGCQVGDPLKPPRVLTSPYDARDGDVLWAVVPLRNESGTGFVDPLMVSDKVVAAIAEVRGLSCLPLNRTIAAMRQLGIADLNDPGQAKQLAGLLGVDALVVGSITAWDPYDPPTVGLSLALFGQSKALGVRTAQATDFDPLQLSYQPTDYQFFVQARSSADPESVVSEHLDARNNDIKMDVRTYAEGRHDPNDALGWQRYLASMDLYTDFASYRAVRRLLEHEWIRLARTGGAARMSSR